MRKSGLYVTIFWIGLGIFVSAYAYKLGIGKFNAPGPGMMPFLLGIVFCLLALYKLAAALLGHGWSGETPKEAGEGSADASPTLYKKLAFVVATLFVYALLLEPLGFLPTTFLTMMLLFRSAGFKRWVIAATYSGIVVLVTYFLFTYLGVRFPPGILRPLGLN